LIDLFTASMAPCLFKEFEKMTDSNEVVVHKPVVTQTVKNCRFYEAKYPEVDDIVVVEVQSIEEMGAYVILKEYNDIQGMILLSELSRRRIRSITKVIRVGRIEVVVVLRVDKEKGYIDLSKRRVGEDDLAAAEEKYNKAKSVHSIMRHVAESQTKKLDLESLYLTFGWDLYKRYGHAYEAFKAAITDPVAVFGQYNLDKDLFDSLVNSIKRRLTPQPVKIRADIEVTCFEYEGIDTIKAALRKGAEISTEEMPVKIKLLAPPLYVIFSNSLNKQGAIDAVNKAIKAIEEEIKKGKGELKIAVAPRVVRDLNETEVLQEFADKSSESDSSDDEDEKKGGKEEK